MWRDIKSFPGYQVSHIGEVRSFWRQVGGNKPVALCDSPKEVKQHINAKNGYPSVTIRSGGRNFTRTVHSLVAEAFIGPRPDGCEVCHGDGNRLNCNYQNLRYDTPKNNQADKIAHGTTNRGSRCGTAKLDEAKVAEIRLFLADGWEQTFVAALFEVSVMTINHIARGRTWRHVVGKPAVWCKIKPRTP